MSFVSVKTKTGIYYYYKIQNGKKVRVTVEKVPVAQRMEKVAVPKKKAAKKLDAPKVVEKKKVAPKVVAPKVVDVPKKKVAPKVVAQKVVEKKKVARKRTTTQCLKVASLRKETKDQSITLKTWMEDPNNVYVGRHGRIFIGTGDEKKIFHYEGSEFANPYKVGKKEGEYKLEDAIELYKVHLVDAELVEKAKRKLKGKNLGCFCDQKGPCHAKVLAEIANGD